MHRFETRVYYEDTDLAGIVYYANYLRYIERARTEFVRTLGVDQVALRDEAGIVFAVRRVEADYLIPAKFDDQLVITTVPLAVSGARISLRQKVLRWDDLCFDSTVQLAALRTDNGRPARLPSEFRAALSGLVP